jgi:hypothetical protein
MIIRRPLPTVERVRLPQRVSFAWELWLRTSHVDTIVLYFLASELELRNFSLGTLA